jgi:hypothetical protein
MLVSAVLLGLAVAACSGDPRSLASEILASASASAPSRAPSADASSPDPSVASPSPSRRSAAEAFRSLATTDGLSYRIAIKGDVLATVSDIAVHGSVSVAGADVATTTVYASGAGRYTVDTRYVGGRLWVRTKGPGAKDKWVEQTSTETIVAPFLDVDAPRAITDFGPRVVDGRTVRSIQVVGGRFLDPATIPAFNLTDGQVRSSVLTLTIDDRGRPLSGRWKQTGTGRVSGQLQELDVDVDVAFSDVGGEVTVTAP